jgi:hypothetical protein
LHCALDAAHRLVPPLLPPSSPIAVLDDPPHPQLTTATVHAALRATHKRLHMTEFMECAQANAKPTALSGRFGVAVDLCITGVGKLVTRPTACAWDRASFQGSSRDIHLARLLDERTSMSFRAGSLALPWVFVLVVLACGGGSGGRIGGSAVCGVNGTNQCDPSQVCDFTLGCVDCTIDVSCPAAAPHCLEGSCVTCISNADCSGATPTCWSSDYQCHMACTSSMMCPQNAQLCTPTGACVGCTTASDCAADAKLCDTATQQCVECQTSGDCPTSAPFCLLREGKCAQCLSNADCGTAAAICDPDGFTCRPGCTDNAGCSTAAPYCDTITSSCVECLTSAQCAGTATPICDPGGRCVLCAADTDCPMASPFCQMSICVQCRNKHDCPASTPTCMAGTCH